MRYPLDLDFETPLSKRIRLLLEGREVVLPDSSALFSILFSAWIPPLGQGKRICVICDFILKEAINAEKWQKGFSKIRKVMTLLMKDQNHLFVEIRTPIKSWLADQRGVLADLLPRVLRRKVIKRNLSGTDMGLLVVAWYLQEKEGLKVLVATRDRELMEACRELGIEARLPKDVEEDWEDWPEEEGNYQKVDYQHFDNSVSG